MAYDIPDTIQYKEKIVFGLNSRQLYYAIGFALLVFFSFRLPVEQYARMVLPALWASYAQMVLPALIVGFGLGFVLFDWDKTLQDVFSFHFGIKQGGAMDPQVKRFIGCNKVENETVYLSNGQMRAVLSVVPVNFENMDKGRQDSLKLNYREFLNQLSHPIQILVRTVNVDLVEYFAHHDERVEKTNNPQLIQLYKEFKLWETTYVNEHHVKERLYYVIIPYNPYDSLAERHKSRFQFFMERISSILNPKRNEIALARDEAQRQELAGQTAIIQQKLVECGLLSRRLTTNNLISLYMSYFDGYVEVDEDYLSRIVVSEKFFEKKEVDAHEKDQTTVIESTIPQRRRLRARPRKRKGHPKRRRSYRHKQ